MQTVQTYDQIHHRSLTDPAGFWAEQAAAIPWINPPTQVVSTDEAGLTRWFADDVLNTCYAAVDYHVENGRADQLALIYDSPTTNTVQQFTYQEVRDKVAQLAGALRAQGVGPGDTVVIYMPMIPRTAFAMLACARIGTIHSVVFGGFAPRELAIRIDDASPKVILSASCGLEFANVIPYKPLLDEALRLAHHQPDRCLILQRFMCAADLQPDRDVDWQTAVRQAEPAGCIPVKATDPLYILYTSGTTGKPKGIIRDNGGHAVALHYSMSAVYDMQPGQVLFTASDSGWVVGHSYSVFAPLLHGCTSVILEGKPVRTPDAGTFWRIVQDHSVTVLFTAPTAFRAIRKEDPDALLAKKYDLSSLKCVFVARERCDPRGQRPVGFVVLKNGQTIGGNQLELELIKLIRANIRAVASFRNALIVKRLPKARSGNILRKTIRQIADGELFSTPPTIDDPAILDEIRTVLSAQKVGLAFCLRIRTDLDSS